MISIKVYNPAFDILKCLAAIMITNSHYAPLYEEYNTAFATLGVHGNALFFFVSGYFLFSSLHRNGYKVTFGEWYQKKLKRLWIPIIVLAILAGCFKPDIGWRNFMPMLWFVKCFLISFPILFFVVKTCDRFIKHVVGWVFVSSIMLTIMTVFLNPPQSLSIFHYFHYICYFPIMTLGVIVSKHKEIFLAKNKFATSFLATIVSFSLYFIIMSFGKGHLDNSYYTQLFGYVPLLFFLIFIYRLVNLSWLKRFSENKFFCPIKIVAILTFEIYIVQKYIITNAFNDLFPFNTVIVFVLIVLAAYIIRVGTVLFEQLIAGCGWNLKKAFRIY